MSGARNAALGLERPALASAARPGLATTGRALQSREPRRAPTLLLIPKRPPSSASRRASSGASHVPSAAPGPVRTALASAATSGPGTTRLASKLPEASRALTPLSLIVKCQRTPVADTAVRSVVHSQAPPAQERGPPGSGPTRSAQSKHSTPSGERTCRGPASDPLSRARRSPRPPRRRVQLSTVSTERRTALRRPRVDLDARG